MSVPTTPPAVCYLIDNLRRGGTETQMLALIRHLDRSKVRPLLCLLDGDDPLSTELAPPDCPLLRLGVRSLRRPSTLFAAVRFMRFLRTNRVKVLHCYFKDSCLFGIPLARLAGVPRVAITQNNLGYWMTPADKIIARVYQGWADALVSNCEAARQAVLRTGGAALERTLILENGIQHARFHPAKNRASKREGALRVGMVANLRPVKNPALFVEVARTVLSRRGNVTFHLAGEGELRPDLEATILKAGLAGRVILEGALTDVPRFLAGLDVAMLTSDSEGLSNAILEYMASGKPVVATAVGATPDLIRHGVTGMLAPAGDGPTLAEAVLDLLNDTPRRHRMGQAARDTVTQRFSMASMAGRFENFYESLLV